MAGMFSFELVSPEKLLLSENVEQVVVPGSEGDFAVLVGHAPVLSTLRTGVIEVTKEDGSPMRVFVRGGLAEAGPETLTILAQHAIDLAELDANGLAQEIKNAEEDVADAKDETARSQAQDVLEQLKAVQGAL